MTTNEEVELETGAGINAETNAETTAEATAEVNAEANGEEKDGELQTGTGGTEEDTNNGEEDTNNGSGSRPQKVSSLTLSVMDAPSIGCMLESDVKTAAVRHMEMLPCVGCCAPIAQCYESLRWKLIPLCVCQPLGRCAPNIWWIGVWTLVDWAFLLAVIIGSLTGISGGEDAGEASSNLAAAAIMLGQRNTVFAVLFGLPFERGIAYHQWFGLMSGVFGTYHFIDYLGHLDQEQEGFLAWLMLVALVVTSAPWIRRRIYSVFVGVHVTLFVLFSVFLIMHESSSLHVASLVWFAFDCVWRCWVATCGTRAKIVSIQMLPGDLIMIEFEAKNFVFEGGQYAWLYIPAVSIVEMHPFSMSSHPNTHSNRHTFHIKDSGDWCHRLRFIVENNKSAAKGISLFVDGPYGRPTIQPQMYSSVIFFAAGIGVTPMLTMFQELMHLMHSGSASVLRKVKRVNFVWSVRSADLLDSFDEEYRRAALGNDQAAMAAPFDYEKLTLNFKLESGQTHSVELKTTLHCTRIKQDTGAYQQARLHYTNMLTGRPNVPDIIQDAQKSVGGDCIGVFGCGPESMLQTLRRDAAGKGIHCHTEVFNF